MNTKGRHDRLQSAPLRLIAIAAFVFKQWYTGFPVTKSHGGEIWRNSSATGQWAPIVTGGLKFLASNSQE